MNKLIILKPTRQAIIIGAAIGIATKNIAVGIVLIIMFSVVSNVKWLRK